MRRQRKNRRRVRKTIYQAVLALAFAFGCGLAIELHQLLTSAPADIAYSKVVSSNHVVLNAIRTAPDSILLKHIQSNVTDTSDNGINGGFFYNGDLISIAVMNGFPLKGGPGDYGSGWYNVDTKKGTLVWDEAARRLSVQVVEDVDEIAVTDPAHYWAQGGVSMSLPDDGSWEQTARKELMPAFDEKRLRSAAVYDRDQNVWLVVSENECTVEEFRSAIKERIGRGKLVDGVFLDGDGSSQMKYGTVLVKGDSRAVYQMLALKSGPAPAEKHR